jgi:hypothetical protein
LVGFQLDEFAWLVLALSVVQIFDAEFLRLWTSRSLTSRRSQPPLALAVPLSRFTPRVGGGSAFFVRRMSIAIKTYFCPRCGSGYESSECRRSSWFSLASGRCPRCDVAVVISGGTFIIVGLVIWGLCDMVLDTNTPLLGAVIGGALGSFGVFRLVRQFLATRKARHL